MKFHKTNKVYRFSAGNEQQWFRTLCSSCDIIHVKYKIYVVGVKLDHTRVHSFSSISFCRRSLPVLCPKVTHSVTRTQPPPYHGRSKWGRTTFLLPHNMFPNRPLLIFNIENDFLRVLFGCLPKAYIKAWTIQNNSVSYQFIGLNAVLIYVNKIRCVNVFNVLTSMRDMNVLVFEKIRRKRTLHYHCCSMHCIHHFL